MPRATPAPELRGILIVLGATLLFGLMDAGSKFLSHLYPTPQILFLRYVFTIPLLLAALGPRQAKAHLRSRRPWLQVVRSLLLVIEIGFVIWTFGRMPLADVHAILALTPLVVTALAVPLLGERVDRQRWVAVAVGFVGILVILRPGLTVLQPAALMALASVLLYALYQILTRRVGAADSAATSLLWQLVIGALATSFLMPFVWQPPALLHWPLFLVLALLGGIGHYAMIRALQLAPASVLQPFTYALLLWAVVIGYLAFGDVPDRWTLLGATVVVGAGIFAAVRERRLRREV